MEHTLILIIIINNNKKLLLVLLLVLRLQYYKYMYIVFLTKALKVISLMSVFKEIQVITRFSG